MSIIKVERVPSLVGSICIHGAKNAALPIIAASLISGGQCELANIPRVEDVIIMLKIIASMGGEVVVDSVGGVRINTSSCQIERLGKDLCRHIRASVVLLGACLARFGRIVLPYPGGCSFASRPIDMHLAALQKMGVKVEQVGNEVIATCEQLYGADIHFGRPTVTGTENILLAAVMAHGSTTINNPAFDPEVIDFIDMLTAMGSDITVDYLHNRIVVNGVAKLSGCYHRIIPDRLELGTYMVATAMVGGEVEFIDTRFDHNRALIKALECAGAKIITKGNDSLKIIMDSQPRAVDIIAGDYPDLPTDMQPQLMALNCIARGDAIVCDNVFQDRIGHALQLRKLGADLTTEGKYVRIRGKKCLRGGVAQAADLRAAASLVLAGLVGSEPTFIKDTRHLMRGYVCLPEKLARVGADICYMEGVMHCDSG